MNHDVFISFSSVNSEIAEKVVDALEESGEIKCWIAYRDIIPSANYAEQLVEAIESCKLVLLILSEDSNKSPQVSREVERAGSKGIPILPLRIEDVTLSKSMEYFISTHHWLDAYEAEIEEYFPALKAAVHSSILGKETTTTGTDTSTRKQRSKAAKGIKPEMMIAAVATLAILVTVMYFYRTDQSPSGIQKSPASVPQINQIQQKAVPPASTQDALIQELAQRYKENRSVPQPETDGWTSSVPLSIAFLDVSGNNVNDAEIDFILNSTGEKLRESKRYQVVEREMIDKLLQELNLSSSDLADPQTALKLGRILSANLIVTGSIAKQDKEWLANLRFIETETTAVKCSVSTLVSEADPSAVVSELNKAINTKLRREFPLQAKIASVSGNSASLNIGESSGVANGMTFDLLQENNAALAAATVTSVDLQQSEITLAANAINVTEGMRLRESVQE